MAGANTEALISAAVKKFGPRAFKAPPKTKYVAGKFWRGRVPVESEQVIILPDGTKANVRTAPDGIVTHVEEADHQHAIVRPDTYKWRVT